MRIKSIVISRDPSFLHWRYRLTTVPMEPLTDQGCQTYLHTETFVIFERFICKFFLFLKILTFNFKNSQKEYIYFRFYINRPRIDGIFVKCK